MDGTIKITIPDSQDMEFYKKIGQIVFTMDQLKDNEAVMKTLVAHIKRGDSQSQKEQEENKEASTSLREINLKTEI